MLITAILVRATLLTDNAPLMLWIVTTEMNAQRTPVLQMLVANTFQKAVMTDILALLILATRSVVTAFIQS